MKQPAEATEALKRYVELVAGRQPGGVDAAERTDGERRRGDARHASEALTQA